MRKGLISLFVSVPAVLVVFFAMMNPPSVRAVPSYARQTGLPCSGCHYMPPELNPAGRRFKLLGYVDRDTANKGVTDESGKKHSPLNILSTLPLSVMFETSLAATNKAQPATQNTTFEFPQDVSLFLSGAWTTHVGSFLQVTYDTQEDHFGIDNTDIRIANKGKLGGKEIIYGASLNNNPGVEDLWNDTPAWGFPWVVSDFEPTPGAATLIDGSLAQDVAGIGGYAMWDNHLYGDVTLYRSAHVGTPQPNSGAGSTFNIQDVAPYWRVAWQESTATTQFEVGTYGMHLESTPEAISGLRDDYTDWAIDSQYDRTLFRTDVLSLRGTYIREDSSLAATFAADGAMLSRHTLSTAMVNGEYHFGNRYAATVGWFDTWGTADTLLFMPSPITGSANGSPNSSGYIGNFSFWPWQNFQLALQYTGYTRFNGASTNYDGSGRSASDNNTVYLIARFIF